MVGTPMAVVLKPPGPAKTRAWVEPVRQGSTSSGAEPPWPQLVLSAGSQARPADPVLVDAVSLAHDDATKGFVRSGEQAARLAHGEPIGVAEIIGPATDQARAASPEPLKSEAPTEQRGEAADRDSL